MNNRRAIENASPTVPFALVMAGFAAAAIAIMAAAAPQAWLAAAVYAAEYLLKLAAVTVAAGGFGWQIVRRFGGGFSRAFLTVCSIAVGLWMISTITLICGSCFSGLLNQANAWLVVGVGCILTVPTFRRLLPKIKFSRRVARVNLLWIVLGLCAGLWLIGAMRPAGSICGSDAYDVLDYHLQVPREYLDAGRIIPLWHNAYSFYPLGAEMLYLFMMALQGGANEGMYLATLAHGLFGALAVAGLFFGMRDSGRFKSWAAAAMFATVPGVILYSWVAFSELAMICYMVLGLFWLRRWLACPDVRTAMMTGLMCGCACSVKYLSVGMIALPILGAMFISSAILIRKKMWHVIAAGVFCVVMMAPWLARNAAYTGNPVFPLATQILGRGHWSTQVEQRWVAGHAGKKNPPVPAVQGWQASQENRVQLIWKNFVGSEIAGMGVTVFAILSAIWIIVRRRWREDAWLLLLMFVIAVQMALWFAFAPNMPPRFILPASACTALLAADGLTRLRWNRMKSAAGLSAVILGAVVVFNLFGAFGVWLNDTKKLRDIPPMSVDEITRNNLPYSAVYNLGPQARVLLVGEAAAFYYPSNVIYCTPFDNNPLDVMPQEAMMKLRNLGVTHILVAWPELWRLAGTYGYPARLTDGLYELQLAGKSPTLPVLDELVKRGATVENFGSIAPYPAPLEFRKKWNPFAMPQHWPVYSLYTLPAEQNHK